MPWPIAARLAKHAEDADALYLPRMVWYGVEGATPAAPERALALIGQAKNSTPLLQKKRPVRAWPKSARAFANT